MTTDPIGRCNPPRGLTTYDRVSTVTSITNWPSLGVKLPKSLADKLDVFDAMRFVETAHAVTVGTSAVTTKNAEDAVAELAARLLPAQAEPGKRTLDAGPSEDCHPGPAR
jgi:hypothetical protein